jgi:hypothetical protein
MGRRTGIPGAGSGHLGAPGRAEIFVGAHLCVRPDEGGNLYFYWFPSCTWEPNGLEALLRGSS